MTGPQIAMAAGRAVSIAGVLLGVYGFFLLVLLTFFLARAKQRGRRAADSAAVAPVLHNAVVDYLSGSSDETVFRRYAKTHREDLGKELLRFQPTVNGSARDRLCELALKLELVNDWCDRLASRDVVHRRTALSHLAFVCAYEPCRRVAGDLLPRALKDPDEEVRLLASRALLQAGDAKEVERVFELAISPNLLTRIVLTEDLRRHAGELCREAVPAVQRSKDPRRIRALLEVLVGWERAIPLQNLGEFLNHPDRDIRILALQLAPLVALALEDRLAIIRALDDEDADVRTLAVATAGRLKMEEAVPELVRCLLRGPVGPARQAAAALAAMPPPGWRVLEELSANAVPAIAHAASDALRRAGGKPGPG
jgi:HEAT repeat protein